MSKNETVIISKDKVYTSYYARACRIIPDYRLISISISIPNNFNGEIMRELNPPEWLLYSYKNGNITEDEYSKIFYEQVLSKLNPVDIYNKCNGKVLLCYCGKDSFCHRKIVLDWLKNNISEDIIGYEI